MATGVIGTGSTVVWSGATGLMSNLLELEWSGLTMTVIEDSNLGTTGGRTYSNGSKFDPGTLSARIRWDGTTALPVSGTTGTMLVTDSAGEKIQFGNAILQTSGATWPDEEWAERTIEFKLAGSITYPT